MPKEKIDKESAFTRIPQRAYELLAEKAISQRDFLILNAICFHLNNDPKSVKYNTCFPGREKIAEYAGYSRADERLDKSIDRLEEVGLIIKVYKGHVFNGKNTSNLYTVIFDAKEAKKQANKVIPISKMARKQLRKVGNKKAPADKQEPVINDTQILISYWTSKASSHNVKHFASDKDETAVSKSLTRYSPSELKEIYAFIWDVWEAPAKVQKAINMDMDVLNYGYEAAIIKSFEQYKAGKYTPTAKTSPRFKRESDWKESEKEKTLESATNTTESKPKSRIFI